MAEECACDNSRAVKSPPNAGPQSQAQLRAAAAPLCVSVLPVTRCLPVLRFAALLMGAQQTRWLCAPAAVGPGRGGAQAACLRHHPHLP
eukprot:scaffold284950_cov17-Tisochrysis_lutea.AAC.1